MNEIWVVTHFVSSSFKIICIPQVSLANIKLTISILNAFSNYYSVSTPKKGLIGAILTYSRLLSFVTSNVIFLSDNIMADYFFFKQSNTLYNYVQEESNKQEN